MGKKNVDLRVQSNEELQEMERELVKDIFNLRNEAKMSKESKKTSAIRKKKRTRARILTILNEKKAVQ